MRESNKGMIRMDEGKWREQGIGHKTGHMETGSARLYYQCWFPENIRRVMVVAHGLGEHSGRYGNLVEYFVPRGYAVFSADHRGHGRSSGIRGHVDSFLHYREDLHAFIQKVKKETGIEKVILVGHSMGGLVSISYGLRYPEDLACLVISSPGLRTHKAPPRIKAELAKVLAHVAPTLLLNNELDPTHVSRDPEVVKAYVEDPLVHDRVSPRFFVEFLREGARVVREAPWLSVPLLLLQAGDDRLVSVDASKEFFAQVGSKKKDLRIYEGHYHEIFNDPDREQVFSNMEAWLGKEVPQKASASKEKAATASMKRKRASKKKGAKVGWSGKTKGGGTKAKATSAGSMKTQTQKKHK